MNIISVDPVMISGGGGRRKSQSSSGASSPMQGTTSPAGSHSPSKPKAGTTTTEEDLTELATDPNLLKLAVRQRKSELTTEEKVIPRCLSVY